MDQEFVMRKSSSCPIGVGVGVMVLLVTGRAARAGKPYIDSEATPGNAPGDDGSEDDPGIQWWLEFLRDRYGAYLPR